jgi:hypothetical protein
MFCVKTLGFFFEEIVYEAEFKKKIESESCSDVS